jgi:asparagine synthase (glutamine-hydrolysing)
MQCPPFITEKARDEHLENISSKSPYALPLLAVSLHGAQIARNTIYIRHGIWPVSPYADAELYKYCQGLPAHSRANKNILRAYHAAYGFPEVIYHPKQNEHFGEFFDKSFSSGKYDGIINQMAADSLTAKLGYVDPGALLEAYHSCKQQLSQENDRWSFHIYAWLNAEINLHLGLARTI